MARHPAYGVADAGMAEQAADGTAQRLGDRADQVAEPALRRDLAWLPLLPLLRLKLLKLLKLLLLL
ncbi:hypothetical protein [Rugamonas sp.]|uniref:hypothetical protein n=1 Tax=Rugamonas sp. TaxID=1926287 RepID=UPI0026005727|nr:hypothetical protein [Rugamonas sp.]